MTAAAELWPGRALAALAGALVFLIHPAPSLAPIAPVVLVPWFALVAAAEDRRDAGWRTWAGATGMMLAAHSWLAPSVGPFLLPVAAAMALLHVPAGLLLHRATTGAVGRAGTLPGVLLVTAAWVLAEYARSWAALGGPWGLMGTSQWSWGPLLSVAAVGGVWLVSAVLVGANVMVTFAVRSSSWRRRGVLVVALAAVLTLAVTAGLAARAETRADTLAVTGVQVGVVHDEQARLERGIALTRRATDATAPADLVVWGESGVAQDLDRDSAVRDRLVTLAGDVGASLLVNADARSVDGRIAKTSRVVTSAGLAGAYTKTRLVPFGEYVPLRPLLGWISDVTEAADEDRVRGDGATTLALDGLHVGPLVCFESAFPDMTRELVRRGADVVVVQSATTTFQDSWAPAQHASLAAVRAVEAGRPVLHATVSGVSAAFDAHGRQLLWVDTDHIGPYEVELPLASGTTPYVRWGDWVPRLAALGLVVAAVLRSRSVSRRRG